MSVRQASQAVQQAKQDAIEQQGPKPLSKTQIVNKAIDEQGPAFKALLPQGADLEKFKVQVATAINAAPELIECFGTAQGKVSLLLAVRQAAGLGLEPNTPKKLCYLEPRRNGGVMTARLGIEYRGWMQILEDCTGGTVFSGVVREGDHFEHSRGLDSDTFEWKSNGDEDSEKTHAFAVVRYPVRPDGTRRPSDFLVMSRAAIEKRRAQSDSWNSDQRKKTAYSPWTKWEDEMWQKTVISKLIRSQNLSDEKIVSAIETDGQILETREIDGVVRVVNSQDENEEFISLEGPAENTTPQVIDITGASPEPVAANEEKESLEGQQAWIEILKTTMKEMNISGPERWEAVLDATGMQPERWSEINEDMAKTTVEFLEARMEDAAKN